MDIEKHFKEIRANFPNQEYEIYYGGCSDYPIPNLRVYEAMKTYWDMYRTGSTKGGMGLLTGRGTPEQELCFRQAEKLINAKPQEVGWVGRPLRAKQIVLDIIDTNMPWKKGDNIVFNDQGYPSSGSTWLPLREKGVELRQVRHSNGKVLQYGGPKIREETAPGVWQYGDLEQAIDEHTKLVCVDRTTWHLGFTQNVKEVCTLAHEKGALVFDDAIQAIGAIPIDVKDDNVDFFCGGGSYKWQCGMHMIGIFYVRMDLIETLKPRHLRYHVTGPRPASAGGFGSPLHDNVKTYDFPFIKSVDRYLEGTVDFSLVYGFRAALDYLHELGAENIRQYNLKLGQYFIDKMEGIGCKIMTPLDDKTTRDNLHLINYTTGSFDNDTKSNDAASKRRPVPLHMAMRYQGGIGGIRAGVHFYNSYEDIDILADFQKDLMPK